MNGLLTLLILAFVAYMLFSRKGGMGCCSAHHGHNANSPHGGGNPTEHREASRHADEAIIDLKKEDYKILPSEDNQTYTRDLQD